MARDHYQMLGSSFSLETDSRRVREFFAAAYRRFRASGEAGSGSLRLVAVMDPAGGRPYAAADEDRIDLSGRPMPENRAFIFLLNALMARVSRFLLLHGAAVSVEGRGMVLCGPAGAGKSTLAMALSRRGAVFFGDDVAPIERSTRLLHPFPRAVGIRKDRGSGPLFDSSVIEPGESHELPHKWLVDPAALRLPLPGPLEAPVPLEAVILVDPSMGRRGRGNEPRTFEVALAEDDAALLAEIGSIDGVSGIERIPAGDYARFRFIADRREGVMSALADSCRRHADVVLYLEQCHPGLSDRSGDPRIEEVSWPRMLIDLSRDLLNRVDGGALEKECRGLTGLIAELGRVLGGARAYRLRPGSVESTVDVVLNLTAHHTGMARGTHK